MSLIGVSCHLILLTIALSWFTRPPSTPSVAVFIAVTASRTIPCRPALVICMKHQELHPHVLKPTTVTVIHAS